MEKNIIYRLYCDRGTLTFDELRYSHKETIEGGYAYHIVPGIKVALLEKFRFTCEINSRKSSTILPKSLQFEKTFYCLDKKQAAKKQRLYKNLLFKKKFDLEQEVKRLQNYINNIPT